MTGMDTVRQTTYKNKRHLSQSTQRSQRMVIFLEAVRGRFQETALPAIADLKIFFQVPKAGVFPAVPLEPPEKV